MKKMNKTTAAVLAASAVAVIGALIALEPSVLAAIQTLLTAVLELVWAT